ncbi:hypothetical protein HK097_003832, partial [Rhizophlyctis rosea]
MSQQLSQHLSTPHSQSTPYSLSIPSDLPLRLNATVHAVTTLSYNPVTSTPASALLSSEDVMISIPDPEHTNVKDVADMFVETWSYVEGTVKGVKIDTNQFSQKIIRNSQNAIIPPAYIAGETLLDSEKLHVLAVLNKEADPLNAVKPITENESRQLSSQFTEKVKDRKRKRVDTPSPQSQYNEQSFLSSGSQLPQRVYREPASASERGKRRRVDSQETNGVFVGNGFHSAVTNNDENTVEDSEVEASIVDADDEGTHDESAENADTLVNASILNPTTNGHPTTGAAESETEEPTIPNRTSPSPDSDSESGSSPTPENLVDIEAIESSGGEDSDSPSSASRAPRPVSSDEDETEDEEESGGSEMDDFIVDDSAEIEEEGSEDEKAESLDAKRRREELGIGKKGRGMIRKRIESSDDEAEQAEAEEEVETPSQVKKKAKVVVSDSEDGDGVGGDEDEWETQIVPNLVSRTLTAGDEEEEESDGSSKAVGKKVNGVGKKKELAIFESDEEDVSPVGKSPVEESPVKSSPVKVETVSPKKVGTASAGKIPAGKAPAQRSESPDEEASGEDAEESTLQRLVKSARAQKLKEDAVSGVKKPAGRGPATEKVVGEGLVISSPVRKIVVQTPPVEKSPVKPALSERSPVKPAPAQKSLVKQPIQQSPANQKPSETGETSVPQVDTQNPEQSVSEKPVTVEKKKRRKKRKTKEGVAKPEKLDNDSEEDKPLTTRPMPAAAAKSAQQPP